MHEHGHHHDHDHGHEHGHDHGHGHEPAPAASHGPFQKDEKIHSYYQVLGLAVKELLIEKGVFTADEIRKAIEFRDSITYRTATVDASPYAKMEPALAKSRKTYWGYDNTRFPLNARVWLPEGAGPFPLVLVVHGNHNMQEFSDPGYGWLGEFLASRGFILASVDMNFLNGNLRNENDARGWMLRNIPV